MSSSGGVEKKITLKSSDGEIFEVEDWVAKESQTINHMMEVNCSDSVFLLAEVTGPILLKVIEYCKKHGEARREKKDALSSDEELRNWDRDFVKVNRNTIWDLLWAANYLNIKSLKGLVRQVDWRPRSVARRVGSVPDGEGVPEWSTMSPMQIPVFEMEAEVVRVRRPRPRPRPDILIETMEEEEELRILRQPMRNLTETVFISREEEEQRMLREPMWHWSEMAKKWLIIFGIVTYIGLCIIRMVWVLYQI